MKETVRVFLSPFNAIGRGEFMILELPLRDVVRSLFNDTPIPPDGTPKKFVIEKAWANGDGTEIILRRVPPDPKSSP
jgi:hypothetical protein